MPHHACCPATATTLNGLSRSLCKDVGKGKKTKELEDRGVGIVWADMGSFATARRYDLAASMKTCMHMCAGHQLLVRKSARWRARTSVLDEAPGVASCLRIVGLLGCAAGTCDGGNSELVWLAGKGPRKADRGVGLCCHCKCRYAKGLASYCKLNTMVSYCTGSAFKTS